MFRKILVPMSGVSERSRHLEVALNLAKDFGAHVQVLHASLDPRDSVAYLGDGMTGTMISRAMEDSEKESAERYQRAQGVFHKTCAEQAVDIIEDSALSDVVSTPSASFMGLTGHLDELVARYGRLADLTIGCHPATDTNPSPPVALEAAIMETGRPVMVIPAADTGWKPSRGLGEKVAVAWYGNPEAARAVAFAMPILSRAKQVEVIYYGEERGEETAADALVSYLQFHDVEAAVHGVVEGGAAGRKRTGEILLDQARELGSDMLVMGAYTHSRLRQIIFGGTTRYVMENADIPVLLAH
jgi:nucleotide-binding universal stress UspA family protein